MKKSFAFLLMILLISASLVSAQTASTNLMVHEDIVKPSMDVKYREALKKLKAACELHKLSFSWNTIGLYDNSYRHFAPLKSFADLDKNPFADLEAKMGKEAFGKLMADFDECLESHSDFVLAQLTELSYLSPPVGENYRDITYWYALPGKEAEAESILGEWKKLYESKKATNGYTVNKVIFGREAYYAIASWGKNAVDAATKAQKTQELLGEEGGKLWMRTQAISKKFYGKRAEVLPEFSYSMPK